MWGKNYLSHSFFKIPLAYDLLHVYQVFIRIFE